MMVNAMAIHARETYGDSLSPMRADIKKRPRRLSDG